jgi:hypothetical protein
MKAPKTAGITKEPGATIARAVMTPSSVTTATVAAAPETPTAKRKTVVDTDGSTAGTLPVHFAAAIDAGFTGPRHV